MKSTLMTEIEARRLALLNADLSPWQPMKTAPRYPQTRILLLVPINVGLTKFAQVEGYYADAWNTGWRHAFQSGVDGCIKPIGWMPLEELPSVLK